MTDADASALLARCCENGSGMHQHFLTHGDTQGDVLEGFVLMALDCSVEELAPLISAYEDAVAPHRAAALNEMLRLGVACHERAPWLLKELDSNTSGAPEPKRIEGMAPASCWDVACSGDAREPFCALFRTLRSLYAHRVVLKPYDYNGHLQLQVDVSDDQIFFGWPLHMLVAGVAPLYRGMVLQFDGRAPPSVEVAISTADEWAAKGSGEPAPPELVPMLSSEAIPPVAVPGARVLAVAKLKCLNYLIRTFGVRNPSRYA